MSVEPKVFEHVRDVLNGFDDKYLNNGKLKRNKIIEDLDAYDKQLMTALLSDQLIHQTYTKKLAGVEIFEVNQFIQMLEFKEYWEDSYTKYSNKIGLTAGGRFIDESEDVVLDFPFKDTVLKAGMSKEDLDKGETADEPFLNEVIAKPEIDELLEPKVFVNAKRYDADGEHEADSFTDTDNLVIKGNNLIALHSLKKRYAGKVKLIYLDPPYYFDKTKPTDAFSYNSNFKLSTWLTFMKNRLEVCKQLLSEQGVVAVSIGEDGQAYLKLLMDDVFGHNNFVETFLWRNTDNADSISKKSRSGIEYIHAYEVDKNLRKQWIGKESENGDAPLLNNGNEITTKIFPAKSIRFKIPDGIYSKGQYPSLELLNDLTVKNSYNDNEVALKGHFKWGQDTIYEELEKGTYFIVKTKNFSIRFQRKNASMMAPEKWVDNRYLSKIYGIGTNEDASAHIKKLGLDFSNPKPESLVAFLIRAVTNEKDIVLDFFMGSATTQAAAMKMHRQFIGIDQMDYINTTSVPRLQKVIEGEQGGISKDVNWQGGGSFVYAELMEKNGGFIRDVEKAANTTELLDVFDRMKNTADFDFRVDLDKFEAELNTFESLADQKRELLRILDKNQLYYNYANIDDADVRDLIADHDYKFSQSFYRNGGED